MSDEDLKLVERLRKGDLQALEGICDRHERVIFNVVYRMTGNYEDTMDITQAVFVKVYQKIDTFNPTYKFFSWLYKIAVNETLNLIQRRKRRRDRDVPAATVQPTPDELMAEHEKSQQLDSALASLKLDYRMVVVLRYFLHLSYRQIGQILDLPEKKVKSRLFTARLLMRDLLTQQGYTR